MEHPEQLVQIGRDVFKQETYLWCRMEMLQAAMVRAAWLGCGNNSFDLIAYDNLDYNNAARGSYVVRNAKNFHRKQGLIDELSSKEISRLSKAIYSLNSGILLQPTRETLISNAIITISYA